MRPEILPGNTKKFIVGCGSLYIAINKNEGKLYEVFQNGSKLGGCRANQEGVSRLVSLCLRKGIDPEEIIDQLSLIKCPVCSSAKAKLETQEQKRNFPTSCPDAVAKMLKQEL